MKQSIFPFVVVILLSLSLYSCSSCYENITARSPYSTETSEISIDTCFQKGKTRVNLVNLKLFDSEVTVTFCPTGGHSKDYGESFRMFTLHPVVVLDPWYFGLPDGKNEYEVKISYLTFSSTTYKPMQKTVSFITVL